MAKEAKVWEIIREAGFEPIENKSIIVSYAPANLSDAIVRFLGVSTEFFALQICRDELVLVSFGSLTEGNWHSENLDSTLQMLQEIAGH